MPPNLTRSLRDVDISEENTAGTLQQPDNATAPDDADITAELTVAGNSIDDAPVVRFETIEIPQEPTLKELVVRKCYTALNSGGDVIVSYSRLYSICCCGMLYT